MTVAAPPRPPHPSDPAELQEIEALEALIEEARQRTRRRHRRYAAATAALALIGVSLFIVFGRSGPSENAAAGLPAPAAAANQDEAATVIAHAVRTHWAWVVAFDDGRVIWQFDGLALRGPSNGTSPLFERRLTPKGVDLLQSGTIQPSTLLEEAIPLKSCIEADERCLIQSNLPAGAWLYPIPRNPSALPAGTWADPEFSTYEPSKWAIGRPDFTRLSESEIDRFPAAAQAVLRGAERATYNNVFLLYPDDPDLVPTSHVESLELTTAELSALGAALIDAGIPQVSDGNRAGPPFVSPDWISLMPKDWPQIGLVVSPILPHGEPIAFAG
jgi:hypothetical protein